jgi:hypothetical protein
VTAKRQSVMTAKCCDDEETGCGSVVMAARRECCDDEETGCGSVVMTRRQDVEVS